MRVMRTWRPVLAIVFLIALLGVAQAQAGLAHLGILWREAVLSWDNPATQLVEDLASQPVPHADRIGETRDRTLAAVRTAARTIRPGAAVALPAHPALARDVCRAPPTA